MLFFERITSTNEPRVLYIHVLVKHFILFVHQQAFLGVCLWDVMLKHTRTFFVAPPNPPATPF
jgi:hypothetical protein